MSAELTYGLERIAMFLQKVDNVFDLEWAPGVKYREVRLREEVEQSKYAFNQDTGIDQATFAAFHREQFDKNYEFGERLLKGGLLMPALEYCLKCSHLFNLLDSSGSVGVTERTAYILRVRQLAVAICKQYAAKKKLPRPRRAPWKNRRSRRWPQRRLAADDADNTQMLFWIVVVCWPVTTPRRCRHLRAHHGWKRYSRCDCGTFKTPRR